MRLGVVPVTLGLALAFATSAGAGSPTEELRGPFATADHILEDPETDGKPQERMTAIRGLIRGVFDFREAARLSLGPDWSVRTLVEQERFVRLYADLLERSFIASVTSRINVGDGVKVSYVGESIDGPIATVRTTLVTRSGLEMPFDYRMVDRGGRWAVCDVAIDGVSIAANYRAQFARVMQGSSYPDLVQQIQARVGGGLGETVREESPAPQPRLAVLETPVVERRELVAPDAGSGPPAPVVPPRPEVEPAPVRTARAIEVSVATKRSEPEPRPAEPSVPTIPVETSPRPSSVSLLRARAYWVQLGAFKSAEAAARLASSVRREDGPPAIHRVSIEASPGPVSLTRVRVGPFADREAAALTLRELQGRGYPAFIAEVRN